MGDEKRLNKSAYGDGTTWGTEADVNAAGAGIRPLNPGVPAPNRPVLERNEITNAHEAGLDTANIDASDFPLDFIYKYDGLENKPLAQVFGTAATPAPLFVVTTSNNKIDFVDAAAATKVASVAAGSYTGTTLATAIAAAMNAVVGVTGTFACAWSTSTFKFTISESAGPTNFELLWNSGTNKATDISTLCGYSDAADDTGAATFTSDSACTGSGAYQHTLTAADDIDDIFGTYATEKGTKVFVVPSWKPYKFSLTVDAGMIKLSINGRGDQVINDSATVTTLGSVTYPDDTTAPRAKFSQAVFRMNDQTGGALGASDAINPKTFTLEYERPLDNEHVASSAMCAEPKGNGKPKCKLSMEFRRVDAVNELYFADWDAETEKKLDLNITGPVIIGTHAYLLQFVFPRLILEKIDLPDGEVIPVKIDARAVVAESAPTGMTVYLTPIGGTVINTRSTALID